MPIAMLCGIGDHLVAPEDYTWLKDELVKENNCSYFKEYDLGHLGLVIPKEKTIFMDMLALLENFSDSDRITVPNTEAFSKSKEEV